jgi:hypothetical protein
MESCSGEAKQTLLSQRVGLLAGLMPSSRTAIALWSTSIAVLHREQRSTNERMYYRLTFKLADLCLHVRLDGQLLSLGIAAGVRERRTTCTHPRHAVPVLRLGVCLL